MQEYQSWEAQLLDRYIRGVINPQETAELFAWLRENSPESISELKQIMEQSYDKALMQPPGLSPVASERLLTGLLDKMATQDVPQVPILTVVSRRTSWLRYGMVAAAVAVVVLATTSHFLFSVQSDERSGITQKDALAEIQAPQTNRATITLANGANLFLDSVGNGQLALQGNIQLVKLTNGQIAYQTATGEILKELRYNTLTNPRGSKVIDMQLADGSHVWLNAGSSITYPVAFVGGERKVELKGEGYFEVAKDLTKQFIVSANGVNTAVLGTHFNVNAYEGAAGATITLLEGSVSVSQQDNTGAIIRPGQQAQVKAQQGIKVVEGVDLPAVMAWKNGLFNFDGMDLKEAMTQLERWYDIQVFYEQGLSDVPVFGEIDRNLNLTDLLEILGGAGFRFRLEAGGKLVLMK